MVTVVSKLTDIQARLDALVRQHKVPGASLGIMNGDELLTFASGVTNVNTGIAVTPDTLFQIGSNTKVYTTTLVMQLVDEGSVALDAPVKRYLPSFALAKAKDADRITVRHLITHTSGIEGDYFEEFGRGEDGLERYVASLAEIGLVHPTGEMWSYCNTGFCIAGRIVETVTGKPYAAALRECVLAPLGLKKTTVLMEEMLAHSCAVGHLTPPGASDPVVAPRVVMSPSQAPAGSVTTSTPKEVLRFVRMHLDGGQARDGAHVLSSASVNAMQQPQAKLPRSSLAEAMGLGWILSDWSGERVIGHSGGTIGQLSFLQVMPDRRFGVFLATNSGGGGALWMDLSRYLFEELVEITPARLPKAPDIAPTLDLRRYAGVYERYGVRLEAKVRDAELVGTISFTGALASLGTGGQQVSLQPIDAELFLTKSAAGDGLANFLEFGPDGRPRYVHVGGRVARRVSEPRKKPAKGSKPKNAQRRSKR